MAPLGDLSAALWLSDQLTGFGGRVGDVVPSRYEAIARVLHRTDQGRAASGRWADVAVYCETTVHPLAQFRMLAGRDQRSVAARVWPESTEPLEGSLDGPTLTVLRDLLGEHTTTPRTCWFALWDGYGGQPPHWREAPVLALPARRYHLFQGPLADVVEVSIEFECAGIEFYNLGHFTLSHASTGTTEDPHRMADQFRALGSLQSPNLWWSDDRAWVVATEIDFDSTLVAGSDALIDQITLAPEIEAFRIAADDSLHDDADTVNMR